MTMADLAQDPNVLGTVSPFPDTVQIQPLTSVRSQSTSVQPGPGEMAALAGATQGQRDVATAQEAVGEAGAEQLRQKALGLEDVSVEERLAQQEIADKLEEQKQRRAIAQGNYEQAAKAVEGHQFHDFWADKSTGQKVIAAIGASLGGFAAGAYGGPNHAMQIIDNAINRDFRMQEAQLRSKEHVAELRRRGVVDLNAELERELAGIELKQAHAHKAAAAQAEAIATRAGIPAAEAKNSVIVAQQNAAASEMDLRARQRLEKHATYTKEVQDTQIKRPGSPANQPAPVFGPGGAQIGTVGDKKQAADVNKAGSEYREARAVLQELEKSYAKGLTLPVVGAEYQRREQLVSRAKTALKNLQELGALAGPDAQLLEAQIGGKLAQYTGAGGKVKIGGTVADLDRGFAASLDSHGLPGQQLAARMRGEAAPAGSPPPAAAAAPAEKTRGGYTAAQYNAAMRVIGMRKGTPEQQAKAQQVRAAFEGGGGGD